MSNVWTIAVAIYAAIVATGALFLEIRRWVESAPRLHVTVSPNMQRLPLTDKKLYVMVFVSNRGSSPTTITNLGLKRYDNWWQRFRDKPSEDMIVAHPIIQGTDAGRTPHELAPGSQWVGAMNRDEKMEEWLNIGRFYVAVYATHREHPTVKRLPRPRQVPQTTGAPRPPTIAGQDKNSGDGR